jgi:hypothetical protein
VHPSPPDQIEAIPVHVGDAGNSSLGWRHARALLIAESSRPLLVAYINFHHAHCHGQNLTMLLTELFKTALRLPLIYRTPVQALVTVFEDEHNLDRPLLLTSTSSSTIAYVKIECHMKH